MSKPSERYCVVDKCPQCGRPGQGVWYMPENQDIKDKLEFVIHHGINGQIIGPMRARGRNFFHYMGVYRTPKFGEIVTTYKARPAQRPNWKLIRERFEKD